MGWYLWVRFPESTGPGPWWVQMIPGKGRNWHALGLHEVGKATLWKDKFKAEVMMLEMIEAFLDAKKRKLEVRIYDKAEAELMAIEAEISKS